MILARSSWTTTQVALSEPIPWRAAECRRAGTVHLAGRFEEVLERPFLRLASLGSRRAQGQDRGAFLLGLGLGVLYVPCAGPVLAAITVAGATGDIGPGTVILTVSFAVGAAIPLLVFARLPEDHPAWQELEAIAGGDFSQRMTDIEPETTEVGRLKRAINAMLGRVDASLSERDATKEATAFKGHVFLVHGVNDNAARVAGMQWFTDRGGREGDKIWLGQWDHGSGCCPTRRGIQWTYALHAWFDKHLMQRDVETGPALPGRASAALTWRRASPRSWGAGSRLWRTGKGARSS